MLGYTQAFSSIGGLLVAIVNGLLVVHAADLPAIALPDWLWGGAEAIGNPHAPWRYTLMSGLIPAIPLIIIRPFLPESPVWREKREQGTLKRPSIAELFSPQLARTTIVTTIMFACSYGAAFGAIQHIPQIVPGLADVQAKAQAAVEQAAQQNPQVKDDPQAVRRVVGPVEQKVAAEYTKMQEIGGLLGRLLFVLLAVRIVSRRSLLRVFQGPGLLLVPLVFWFFLSIPNRQFLTLNLSSIYLGELPVTTVSLGVLLSGAVHGRPIQLLGQLSAARLPGPPAGHGRKLRGQHRRTDARHILRLGHRDRRTPRVRRDGTAQNRSHRRRRRPVRLRRGLPGQLLPARTHAGHRVVGGVGPVVFWCASLP